VLDTNASHYLELLYCYIFGCKIHCPEVKFLVTKFEFGGSFVMSLEGDCHEVEVTPNLELLVTFGMSLERVFYGKACRLLFVIPWTTE
jgi:hypothetical protein